MSKVLEIKNAHLWFNKGTVNENYAIKGLNLTLRQGDYVTVIGGNGAGKSTLLNLVAGVYSLAEGEIHLDNENITKLKEHKRAKFLGRVFQDPMLGTAGHMTVAENLSVAQKRGQKRKLFKAVSSFDKKNFSDILKSLDLGLEERLEDTIGLLSGGQRQAITLLMSTLKKPKLLLLDEHTAALDPKTAKKVLKLTDEVIYKNNLTALMITHNMKDAIAHGNRLIMMSEGKIVVDVQGEEKNNLTVEKLLELFEANTEDLSPTDAMLLA